MIDEDFRTLLVNLLPTNTTIEKGKISSEDVDTRVYMQRTSAEQDLDLDGTGGLITTTFAVEVGTVDEDTSQTMIAQLKSPSLTLAALSGAANTTATSLSVASTANLPTSGLPFIVQIDSEKMLITGIANTALTVTRAYKSTSAANHANGASLTIQGLHGYRGTVGGTGFLGIFVSDHDDEYQPNLTDDDEGFFISTFQAQCTSLSPGL